VLDSEPKDLKPNSFHIYNDYSSIIHIETAKVCINRKKPNYFPFKLEKSKSYSTVSIIKSLAFWSGEGDLESVLLNATSLVSLIKLKSELIGFLYSVSKMNARTLMNKCNEAKALFSSESVQSSLESFKFTSSSKGRRLRLFSGDSDPKSSQFSESFEYSLSFQSKESLEDCILSQSSILNDEEKDKRYQIQINSPVNLSLCQAETPVSCLKQFEMPSGKLKLICKLQDTNFNSTCPLSVDSDKIQTNVSEYFQVKSPGKSGCCRCERCVIF
jgi:hypothetical protein